MEIQGEEEQIDRVIMSINAGRYVSVERMDVKNNPSRAGEWFQDEIKPLGCREKICLGEE